MNPDPPDCPLHELPMIRVPQDGSREHFRCPNPRCSIQIDRPQKAESPNHPER